MIHFFQEDISISISQPKAVKRWVEQVVNSEGAVAGEINYIFCSDLYLHSMNVQYLDHDTYTDIVTFDQSDDDEEEITGDIFISVERVKENASTLKEDFENELHRVMIHGILHLLGYGDKSLKEKQLMREKEDACLSLRQEYF